MFKILNIIRNQDIWYFINIYNHYYNYVMFVLRNLTLFYTLR